MHTRTVPGRERTRSLEERVPQLVGQDPHVTAVELRGSRARGDAGPLSDWDFVVSSDDPAATMRGLPQLVQPLGPLVRQWDRLSDVPCFMLILPGPTKVDLIFEGQINDVEPPWKVSADTLPGIDEHFWDWILWLASKADAGKAEVVADELDNMQAHLLGPMGGTARPETLSDAVGVYLSLRAAWEQRVDVDLASEVQRQVLGVISELSR